MSADCTNDRGNICLQVQQAKDDAQSIKVSVINDGSIREGIKGVTSSMDIAKQIDKKLVKAALSSSVDGQVWDLTRPLQGDCTIQILTWEDAKGKDVRFSPHQNSCLTHKESPMSHNGKDTCFAHLCKDRQHAINLP